MPPISPDQPVAYHTAGVDTAREELALQRLTSQVRQTWPTGGGVGTVKLDLGYFANVIDVGGIGLAISTDGVGTKALVAQMLEKYDTIGIDCVAMNVNDLLCVGATPVSMVDYIAVQAPHPELLEALARGLCDGARLANISISGGEIAQMRDIVKGYREGFGFDLAGTAVGTVPLDKILVGQALQAGDVVLGIESNGIHSNGLTLARHVFFERHHYAIDASLPPLDRPLGEELLRPTHIYVREVLDLLRHNLPVKALIHITSDGLLNLTRVASAVGYVIEVLPVAPPIFPLIQTLGDVSDAEMFRVYNMGIGFCIIVQADVAEHASSLVQAHGKRVHTLGRVVLDEQRRVHIKPKGLVGVGNQFFRA
jgi:phosphoribosylformylglycinamidine cyclo-ligase